MRNKISVALAGVAAFAVSAPAFAQTAEFDGPYVAVSGGYDFQGNDPGEKLAFDRNLDGTFGDTVVTSTNTDAFSPGFCDGRAQGSSPTSGGGCENDRSRISYNARLGFDKQFGNIVVGVVGEVGSSNIKDFVSGFSTTPASYTITTSLDYSAAARARLGFAADRTLFYGTGGVAYANLNHKFETSNVTNTFTPTGGKDGWGWTAGGGVEQKINDNISIGVEYLYTNIKDDEYSVRVGRGTSLATNPFILGNANGTDIVRTQDRFAWHSARAVLAFRF